MEEEYLLEQLGLSKHSAKLYLILLRLGEASAVTLAKEAILHRRTVYDEMERLQKKGMINIKIKKFVKYFSPVNPEKLHEILEEKQLLLGSLLPKLIQQFQNTERKTTVNIFEGSEGMKSVLNDALKECLKKKDELIMLGAGLKTLRYMKYSFPHYVKYLQKVRWRLIEPDIPQVKTDMLKWNVKTNVKNCRFLPAKYLSPLGILAYTDRTIIMLLENEPILIQIIGHKYSGAFKNYFEILWTAAK